MTGVDFVCLEGDRAVAIMNEDCPFTREIWAAGYDAIQNDHVSNCIRLYIGKELKKEIDMFDFRRVCSSLRIKTGILYDESKHSWISEADGSAEKFRQLIN